jgi:striatin 1/3/4
VIKGSIRGHFDAVRSIIHIPHIQMVVSASDDCLVKIWRLKNMKNAIDSKLGVVDPCITLRGHTDSVVCLTGPNR